jgi:hypothetical protein
VLVGVQLARAGGHLGEIGRTLGELVVKLGYNGGKWEKVVVQVVVQACLVVVIGRKWEKIGRKVGVQIDCFLMEVSRRVGVHVACEFGGLRSKTRRSLQCPDYISG